MRTDVTDRAEFPKVSEYANTFAVIALQDYYSGNSSWDDVVYNGIQAHYAASGLYDSSPQNSESIYWALVFFYAYRTYKRPLLLDLAKMAYNQTYTLGFIDIQAASNGTGAGRSVPFLPPPNCTNCEVPNTFYTPFILREWPDTLAGGVFWVRFSFKTRPLVRLLRLISL